MTDTMSWYEALVIFHQDSLIKALMDVSAAYETWDEFFDSVQFTYVNGFNVTLMLRKKHARNYNLPRIEDDLMEAFSKHYGLETHFKIQVIP